MRGHLLVVLLPLVLSYPFSLYTGGDVHIFPGKTVKIGLPGVNGDNCLPVVILRVRGGEDYPRINVNGREVVGGGVHRVLAEGNIINITIVSNSPSTLLGSSEVLCTRDPFIDINYIPPPIIIGNTSRALLTLTNRGYTGTSVDLHLAFNPNVAPLSPPPRSVFVPARSRRVLEIVTLADGILKGPSAHPMICINYKDSLGEVERCTLSSPAWLEERPLVVCTNTCYNASWVTFELNGASVGPGDPLPSTLANLKQMHRFEIIVLRPESGTVGENWMGERTLMGGSLLLLSVLMLALRKP